MSLGTDLQLSETEGLEITDPEYAITLEKSWQVDGDTLITRYTLASAEADAVEVSFTDVLPVTEPDEIGWNPDHTPMAWDRWGDEISVVHQLPPHETAILDLGLVVEAQDELNGYEAPEPVIQTTNTIENATEELTAPQRNEPYSEDDTFPEAEEYAVTEDSGQANSSQDTGASNQFADENSNQDAWNANGSVLSALVDELADTDTDSPLLGELRSVLSVDPSPSEQIRLHHVQARMDDLAAYLDSLESVIDDRGGFESWANEIDEKFETQSEIVHESISQQDEQIQSVASTVESFDTRIAAIESDLEIIQASLADMRSVFDALEDSLATVTQNRGDDL